MSSPPMIVRTLPSLRRALDSLRKKNATLALVPTMGALHDGHVSLVRQAQRRATRVIVSIFVNPAQFAPHEDFGSYPRTWKADVAKLTAERVDLIWNPDVKTMYPEGFATRILTEVEFQLEVLDFVVEGKLQDRGKRSAHLAAETRQRPDCLVLDQLLDFGNLELPSPWNLRNRELTFRTSEPPIILLHLTAAIRTRCFERRIIAGNGVGVVFLRALHDGLGHARDFLHERVASKFAALHLGELVFPLAGQFGRCQFFHAQTAQKRHQLKCLGGRDQVAGFAHEIFLAKQPFDDRRARGRRAEPLGRHRLAQFVVLDDHTIRIDFLRKDKLTLPDLAVVVPAVFNSKLARSHASDKDPWAMEWMKTNDAGGGAYRIESWKPGQETVYARFDDWKSGPAPKIRRVIVREIPSAGTRRAMLEKGDADISFDLPDTA